MKKINYQREAGFGGVIRWSENVKITTFAHSWMRKIGISLILVRIILLRKIITNADFAALHTIKVNLREYLKQN